MDHFDLKRLPAISVENILKYSPQHHGLLGQTAMTVGVGISSKATPMSNVARILPAIIEGDAHAAEQLLPLVCGELPKLAAQRMAPQTPGKTLPATISSLLQEIGEIRFCPSVRDQCMDGLTGPMAEVIVARVDLEEIHLMMFGLLIGRFVTSSQSPLALGGTASPPGSARSVANRWSTHLVPSSPV